MGIYDDNWKEELIQEHWHIKEQWTPLAIDANVLPAGLSVASAGAPNAGSFGAWVAATFPGAAGVTSSNVWTDIDRMRIEYATAGSDIFEIEIGVMNALGVTVGITKTRWNPDTAAGTITTPVYVRCPRIAPGSTVSVRCRNSTANSRTLAITLGYHEHPMPGGAATSGSTGYPYTDSNQWGVEVIENHLHIKEQWDPDDATTTNVCPPATTLSSAGGGTPGAFGSWVSMFTTTAGVMTHVDQIMIGSSSTANEPYEIQIGTGGVGSEQAISTIMMLSSGATAKGTMLPVYMKCRRIAGGESVSCRVRNQAAATKNCLIMLGYHEYPAGV